MQFPSVIPFVAVFMSITFLPFPVYFPLHCYIITLFSKLQSIRSLHSKHFSRLWTYLYFYGFFSFGTHRNFPDIRPLFPCLPTHSASLCIPHSLPLRSPETYVILMSRAMLPLCRGFILNFFLFCDLSDILLPRKIPSEYS